MEYDVIIVGGGPAGSTTAALVAESGRSVLVLERDVFPRFKIGESLMPGTYWTLQRLGIFEKMQASAFPKKFSVQFFGKSGKAGAPFYFKENEPEERAQTWQVLRSDFDQLMIDNAVEKGTVVQHGVSVLDVVFDGDRATGVIARMPDKSTKEFKAKVIVDASGQSALISRKLKNITHETDLQNAAIYTHFKGAVRDCGVDEGATLIMQTETGDSWFWYIPLPNDVVSVGVVGHIDYLLKNRKVSAEEIFNLELAKCKSMIPRVDGAEQLFPFKATKEFSYKAESIAGNGWVLVGDAFGFLDPIYSSGIFIALKSGEMAADAIIEAFEKENFTGTQLGKFEDDLQVGIEAIRRLVYAFYSKEFSFGKFLQQFPECRRDIINILVGNVYREDVSGLFRSFEQFGLAA